MERNFIANLNLYPGVYYGKSRLIYDEDCKDMISPEILDKMKDYINKDYNAIFSIGPPIQYEIKDFFYEVLLFEKFPVQEFYGLKLRAEIIGFIRPMAKFANFDSFIKSMWNDIETAKRKLKALDELKQSPKL